MQPQIVHEAEVHRQHVRLQVPISVEIDGNRYTVDDWSIGGFGIESEITSRQPGERFPARMIFPFEDFEVSLRLDCQMVYILEDNSRFGCKLLELSRGQIALFRYLIDAYLSGELISGGDILSIAGRDDSAEARAKPISFNPYADEEHTGKRIKRVLGTLLLLITFAGLVGIIGFGLNERFIKVRAENAVVHAPLTRVRAPLAGTVTPVDTPSLLTPGTKLGSLRSNTGRPVDISSPCDCILVEWYPSSGGFAEQGEEIAVLVSSRTPLSVRANVTLREALRLAEGDQATIRVPGREASIAGEIERVDTKRSLSENAAARDSALVYVRPAEPLDFDMLGSIVDVTFP